MRHTVLVLIAAVAALIAWRVHALVGSGRELHAREVQARDLAERILRAQEARRVAALPGPYEYLSALLAERRVSGMTAVPGGERERFLAGGYVFHVRLLNRLGRPLGRRPADPAAEPGLGQNFELWAWPADTNDTALALFFGSDAGWLLQGDNGTYAGVDARPEDGLTNPWREIDRVGGASDQWVPIVHVRADG